MKTWIILALLLACTQYVAADGGYFGPPHHDQSYEPSQDVILMHDGSTETLIIRPSFSGDASSFVWVVPLPAEPSAIEKSDKELFLELERYTLENFHRNTEGIGLGYTAVSPGDVGIYFHERKQVGIYDTVVMSGWNSENFVWWMQKEGFAIPDAAQPLIQEYMDKSWVFVAIKINGTDFEGELEPVKFVFNSTKPIYPLKISSINQGPSDIRIFVLAGGPASEEGFAIYPSGIVTALEVNNSYPLMSQLLLDRDYYYLTRLERTMSPEEMTDDLELSVTELPPDGPVIEPDIIQIALNAIAGIIQFIASLLLHPLG
jgi:hypothetical protein